MNDITKEVSAELAREFHREHQNCRQPGKVQYDIRVHFVFPPIPDRSMDWCATFDNYNDAPDSHHPIGYGRTPEDAVANLMEAAWDQEREDYIE